MREFLEKIEIVSEKEKKISRSEKSRLPISKKNIICIFSGAFECILMDLMSLSYYLIENVTL